MTLISMQKRAPNADAFEPIGTSMFDVDRPKTGSKQIFKLDHPPGALQPLRVFLVPLRKT